MINIEGLDRGKVLAALYNASRPQGMGFLHYDPKSMTEETGRELLKGQTYFDYLMGRVMKVDLSSEKEFDEWLYDRDNGRGAAQLVIEQLRTFGTTEKGVIGVIHETGRTIAAEDAREMTKSKTTMDHGVLHLGAEDVGPELNEAVDRAVEKK